MWGGGEVCSIPIQFCFFHRGYANVNANRTETRLENPKPRDCGSLLQDLGYLASTTKAFMQNNSKQLH